MRVRAATQPGCPLSKEAGISGGAALRLRLGTGLPVLAITTGVLLVLLLLGFFLDISILWTIGIIVLVVGVVLFALGAMERAVGGRKHYF